MFTRKFVATLAAATVAAAVEPHVSSTAPVALAATVSPVAKTGAKKPAEKATKEEREVKTAAEKKTAATQLPTHTDVTPKRHSGSKILGFFF